MSKAKTRQSQPKPLRESHFVRIARLAYQTAQASLPRYSHPKSPHRFTLPQLAACVLMGYVLKLSTRDTEEWLLATDSVRAVLELREVPDHSTISRTLHRLNQRDLQRMLNVLLAAIDAAERGEGGEGLQEEYVAVDSTYYAATQASPYYLSRAGRTMRTPFKGGYAVGTQSLLVLAVRTGLGTGQDMNDLALLRRSAKRYGKRPPGRPNGRRQQVVLADSGYDGRQVIEQDLIPPNRRNGIKSAVRKAQADRVSQARLDGLYGQRWKAETVNSVIKRKFGSAVRARKLLVQRREAFVRALIYNLHLLLCWLQTACLPAIHPHKQALA